MAVPGLTDEEYAKELQSPILGAAPTQAQPSQTDLPRVGTDQGPSPQAAPAPLSQRSELPDAIAPSRQTAPQAKEWSYEDDLKSPIPGIDLPKKTAFNTPEDVDKYVKTLKDRSPEARQYLAETMKERLPQQERGIFSEIEASAVRGAAAAAEMPEQVASILPKGTPGLETVRKAVTEPMAEWGKGVQKEYAASPSVSGEFKASDLVSPHWWASRLPSLAVQLAPLVGAELATGGAALPMAMGATMLASDAGQRMMDWEKEHGKEIPAVNKILVGLGAGTVGAVVPARAIEAVFKGVAGETLARAIVHDVLTSGGTLGGITLAQNAFEKIGYNPDQKVTQGVVESLALGFALGGVTGAVKRPGEVAARRAADEAAKPGELPPALGGPTSETAPAEEAAPATIDRPQYEQLRKDYELSRATPAQRVPTPTPEEAQAQIEQLKEEYRQGQEVPIISENLPPEAIEQIRQGKPVSDDINDKLIRALVGERSTPVEAARPPGPMTTSAHETMKQPATAAPEAAEATPGPPSLPGTVAPGAPPAEVKPAAPTTPPQPMGTPSAATQTAMDKLAGAVQGDLAEQIARGQYTPTPGEKAQGGVYATPVDPEKAAAWKAQGGETSPEGTTPAPTLASPEIVAPGPSSEVISGRTIRTFSLGRETDPMEVKGTMVNGLFVHSNNLGGGTDPWGQKSTWAVRDADNNIVKGGFETKKAAIKYASGEAALEAQAGKEPWENERTFLTDTALFDNLSSIKEIGENVKQELRSRVSGRGGDVREISAKPVEKEQTPSNLLGIQLPDPHGKGRGGADIRIAQVLRSGQGLSQQQTTSQLADIFELTGGEARRYQESLNSILQQTLGEHAMQKSEPIQGMERRISGLLQGKNASRIWESLQKQKGRLTEQALSEGKSVPAEVLADYPDLAKSAPAPSTIPPEVADFMAKYGSRQGPPEVLSPEAKAAQVERDIPAPIIKKRGKGRDVQRAIERTDLADLLHNLGGVDPRTYKDFISTPEERQKLGRTIGKVGGLPLDIMIREAKAHFPDQFGHFEDAEDMVRYFLDGRHERFLNQKSIEQQFEDHYADIEDERKRRGVSEAGLAELEADVAREIAAEREAIRSEGSAGAEGADLDAGWTEPPLRPGAPRANRLETRLDEIQAEFPDIDRDKAAQVLRALPNAENGQVANMTADPEMFSQVARGNLAAAQQGKPQGGGGTQGGLPGMEGGEPGGGRLFKAGDEAKLDTHALGTDLMKERLGKGGSVTEINPKLFHDSKYARGWEIDLKGGHRVMVYEAKDRTLELVPGEGLGAWEALGLTIPPGQGIAGAYTPMNFASIIELGRGQGTRTFDHETWHMIEEHFLTAKERAAIVKDFGDNEEVRADAYANWNPKEAPNTIFQKIMDIFQRILKALTGKETGEDVFAKARSGELFGREAGGGLPDALAPSKARIDPTRLADLSKPELNQAISQGLITKEFYDKNYAEKYGEWNSEHWARSFPDFAVMGVRMAREDGTVASERRFRLDDEGGEWGMAGGLRGRVVGNVEAAKTAYQATKNWFLTRFASDSTSEGARRTKQVISGSQAESKTEKLRMQNTLDKYKGKLGKIADPANQEFLRLYENGNEDQINDPHFKAFGEYFREEERRQMEIQKFLDIAPKEIPNYFDHLWQQDENAEQIKAQLMSQVSGGRSMRGPDYYKLLRTIIDIPTGMQAGLVPKYDNLPDMALAGRTAREISIAAGKRLKFIKENGYEKVVRNLDGGTFTVETADGDQQTFKNVNAARRFAKDNPGSSEPHFEPDVPQDWKIYPGGYGEVWAKVQRRAGAMIPEGADEDVMPLGGGPERRGYEEVPGVNAWTRVGHRVGPADVVRQFEDFLGKGLSGNTAFEGYQSALHVVRHSQMVLSLFHATFESINSTALHAGEGLADLGGLFTGNWTRAGRGVGELLTSPLAVGKDIKFGIALNKLLMEHGMGLPGEVTDNANLKLARALVGGGQHPMAETDLIKIMSRHFKEAFKARGEMALGQRMSEIVQGLSAPLMEWIVPFSKMGSTAFKYMREVERWQRNNPGAAPTVDDLQKIAYRTRQNSDFIYGQMARDNVAMNSTLRSLLTGVIQYPNWQVGSVGLGVRAGIGAKDVLLKVKDMMQGKEIRQLDIKDRQALQYSAGLIFTIGMAGGLMTYAMTGKKPETMADYFFPLTGEKNPNGSDERLQLPSYFKDAMGITHHPLDTIGAKLASPIHILSDLIKNKDYWGNQISDPHDWAGQRGVDILKYMGKTTAPFALSSYGQGAKKGPERFGMSLLGIRPVPRETANTPMMNVVDEYNQIMRASTTTKEGAATKTLKSDLMKMARDQDEAGFQDAAQEAVSGGKLTRAQVKEIADESQVAPGQTRFYRLPLEWMARAMDVASEKERADLTPLMLKKISSAKPEMLIRNREALVPLLQDMGYDDVAASIQGLEMPEEPLAGMDLAGLGIQPERPEAGGSMADVDAAISASIEKNLAKISQPKKQRKKKDIYEALGL